MTHFNYIGRKHNYFIGCARFDINIIFTLILIPPVNIGCMDSATYILVRYDYPDIMCNRVTVARKFAASEGSLINTEHSL